MLPESFSQLKEEQTFVGIDFGTSTTVVSVATYDSSIRKIKVQPIYLDQMLEDGEIIILNIRINLYPFFVTTI